MYLTEQIGNQHMSSFRPASQFAAGVGGWREKSVSVHGDRPLPRQGVRYGQLFILVGVLYFIFNRLYNTYKSSAVM